MGVRVDGERVNHEVEEKKKKKKQEEAGNTAGRASAGWKDLELSRPSRGAQFIIASSVYGLAMLMLAGSLPRSSAQRPALANTYPDVHTCVLTLPCFRSAQPGPWLHIRDKPVVELLGPVGLVKRGRSGQTG